MLQCSRTIITYSTDNLYYLFIQFQYGAYIRLREITVCKKSVYSCCLRMYNFIYFYCCHHFIYMYMDVFIRNKLSINQQT